MHELNIPWWVFGLLLVIVCAAVAAKFVGGSN
jgi:hypothetical protein